MVSIHYRIPVNCSTEELWATLINKVEKPGYYISGVGTVSFKSLNNGSQLRQMQRNGILVQEIISVDTDKKCTRFELKNHPVYHGYIENIIHKKDGIVYLTYQLAWEAHTGEENPDSIKKWFDKAVNLTIQVAEAKRTGQNLAG